MSLLSARPHRLGERYVVQDVLGRGGMADVYRAHDDVLDRPVAVKVLRDVRSEERFRVEARTLARLAHPGLVTVLDAGVSDGLPWLVMELVQGGTLADLCRDQALPPARVAELGRTLADALAYVHRNGLVHRDVKPGNVLLADDGRVLLADFGVARLVEGATPLTETGVTMGTAAYLAPEQVRGEPLTPAADVYALGLVLLESLTGRRTFPGATAEAALARLSRAPEVPAELPTGWRSVLTGMTALDASARPTADQVARELRRLALRQAGTLPTVPLRVDPTPTRPLTRPVATTGAGAADRAAATTAVTSARAPQGPGRAARWAARVRRVRLPAVRVPVRAAVVLAAAAVLGVLVLVLVAAGSGGGGAPAGPRLPSGVPTQVGADLRQLHDAVEGR